MAHFLCKYISVRDYQLMSELSSDKAYSINIQLNLFSEYTVMIQTKKSEPI